MTRLGKILVVCHTLLCLMFATAGVVLNSTRPPYADQAKQKVDEVAFMRFASVYQGGESLADVEAAINVLRANREYTESGESFDLDETKRLTDR